MQKITPFLWFDREAEEAAKFYVSVFKNSRILQVTRFGQAGASASGRPAGSVMTVEFQLDGQEFLALNGGPHVRFNDAVSLFVNCKTQKEVDTLWKKLSAGGAERPCGWVKDKFGLSWQIVPAFLLDMHADKDSVRRERVMAAMLQMHKLDIKTLRSAYKGK